MKKLFLWLIVVVVLAGGGYWAFQNYAPQAAPAKPGGTPSSKRPSAPKTSVVIARDINFSITASGDIGPVDTVSVRPEVGGLIAVLTLDIGDKVKKGDILFTLDDKDLQTEKSSRKTEIAGARLAVETQKIQLERSKLAFDRIRDLFATKLVSQEVFDNARLDHDLTKNNLNIAKNRLETSETALQQVEDKLGKTIIRAPFDSTILTRPVSVGQAVSGSSGFNSGTEVFTVANLSDMITTAHINQADVTRLKVGQQVTVDVEAVAGLRIIGRVDRIAPQATYKNGIKGYSTRIILKNAEERVRPGMTASLKIPLVSAGNVLSVPLAAVFTDQGDRFVYVKKGEDKFERQSVQLGVADYDYVQIIEGLHDGDEVSLVAPSGETSSGSQVLAGKGGASGEKGSSSKKKVDGTGSASKSVKPEVAK